MKTNIMFLIILGLLLLSGATQAEPWNVSLEASLMAAQNSYSDNWTGGETGSLAWTANVNMLAKKALSELVKNRNTVKLSFGQTHNQVGESKKWQKPYKSSDLIDLESLFRLTLNSYVDPFASIRFESQFLDVSDPAQSRMINPLQFTEGVGVARSLLEQESNEWSIRLGFAFKQRLNRDVLIDPAQTVRKNKTAHDGGVEFISDLVWHFAENKIKYSSKLSVYQAIFSSQAEELKDLPEENYWQALDVNWENIFSTSITKYLAVDLYTQLLYDKEINLAGRFKQTLALGLTYKFI